MGAIPAAPPPKARAKRGKGLFIGLGVGAVAIGGAVAAAVALTGGGGSMLPFPIEKLPKDTRHLRRASLDAEVAARLHVKRGDLTKQARWSVAADKVCNGQDVVGALMLGAVGAPRAAEALYDREGLKSALSCGKAFASELKGDAIHSVRFGTEKETQSVDLVSLGSTDLSGGKRKTKSATSKKNLSNVGCVLEPDQKDCEDKSLAFGMIEGTKVVGTGTLQSLYAFGAGYAPSGDPSKELTTFAELSNTYGSLDKSLIGLGADFTSYSALGETGEVHPKDAGEALEKAVRGAAVAWAYGEKGSPLTGEERWEFVAKSEAGAKDIEKALSSFQKQVVADSQKKADERAKCDPDLDPALCAFEEADHHVGRDAYAKGTTTRDERRVTFVVKWEAKDADERAISDYLGAQQKRLENASEVVDLVLDGTAVPDALLEEIGGKKLVDAVKDYKPGAKDDKQAAPVASAAPTAPAAAPPAPPKTFGATTEIVPGTGGFRVAAGGRRSPIEVKPGVVGHNYTYVGTAESVLTSFLTAARSSGFTCVFDDKAKGAVFHCVDAADHLVNALVMKESDTEISVFVVVPR